MAKFINADALKLRINPHSAIQRVIDSIPAADVRPERYGEWVEGEDWYHCSVCGLKAPYVPQYQDEPITYTSSYCPRCGARMNGKGGGTNEET